MIGRKAKRKFSPPRSAAERTTTRSDMDHGCVEETSSGMNRTKATSHHAKLTHSQKTDATATKQSLSSYLKEVRVVEEREGFIHKVLLGVDGTEIDVYAYPAASRTYYYSDDPDEGPVSPLPEGVSLFASFFPGYEMDTTYIDTDEFEDDEEHDEDEDEDETANDV